MNLLLINYEYPPIGGGAATATYHTAHELAKQGHQVIVLSANYQKLSGWIEEEGVKVYRCKALRKFADHSSLLEQLSFVISAAFILPRLLKKYAIEGTIIYFSLPDGPLGLWGKILKKTPYVISLRGGDVPGVETSIKGLHYFLTPIRRLILKHSLAIVANSQGLKQASQQIDFFPVVVIPNGVDIDFFRPNAHNSPGFRFLFVGRFHQQKNLFFTLEQLEQLRKNTDLPFEFHIVGDGPLKNSLQAYANQLNLNSIIKWHGWLERSKILELYQHSDCLLNLSLYEGMPNVVLEAMSCGLPIIASKVIGNDAVVQHGKTGYLVDLKNTSQLQEILLSLLDNPKLAKQLGHTGRDWVVKAFSWANVAKEYVQLFSQHQ
jgi:glycosyltransferase involved in cell wall biosynthesis